jgi:hypothetical protein
MRWIAYWVKPKFTVQVTKDGLVHHGAHLPYLVLAQTRSCPPRSRSTSHHPHALVLPRDDLKPYGTYIYFGRVARFAAHIAAVMSSLAALEPLQLDDYIITFDSKGNQFYGTSKGYMSSVAVHIWMSFR